MESVRKNLPALEKSKDLAKPLPLADLSIDLALSDSEDEDEALLLEQLKEKENVPAAKQPSKTTDSDSDAENDLMEALANLKPQIQPKPQKQPKARNTLQPQNPPKPQDPPKAQNPLKPQNPPEAQNLPKPQKTSNKAAAPSTVAMSKYHARKNELKFYEQMAAMAVPVVPVKPLPKPRRSEPASNPRFAEMEAKKERELVKRNDAIARKQAKEQAADAVHRSARDPMTVQSLKRRQKLTPRLRTLHLHPRQMRNHWLNQPSQKESVMHAEYATKEVIKRALLHARIQTIATDGPTGTASPPTSFGGASLV